MNPHFPRNGRAFTLGSPLAGSRSNAWDTGCPGFTGECGGRQERIPEIEVPVSDTLRALLSVTVPYPVDRWAIYVPSGLTPSSSAVVVTALPPTVFIEARVGVPCECDSVKIFQWDAVAFDDGQLLGIVQRRLSTTLELWGRVESSEIAPGGAMRLAFRILIDAGGGAAASPVIQLGPNVV